MAICVGVLTVVIVVTTASVAVLMTTRLPPQVQSAPTYASPVV
jgi:hypothetical protein